jgi:hypothetical protein
MNMEGALEVCKSLDAVFTVQSCCTELDNGCQAMSSHLTVSTLTTHPRALEYRHDFPAASGQR